MSSVHDITSESVLSEHDNKSDTVVSPHDSGYITTSSPSNVNIEDTSSTMSASSSIVAVYEAIEHGQKIEAKSLLEDYLPIEHINSPVGRDIPDKQVWHEGYTCLHLASQRGFDDLVEVLFDMGATGSLADKRGRTALHCAATSGWPKVIRILLESKVDSSTQDNFGKTALHCLCDWKCTSGNYKQRSKQLDIANLLLENNPSLWEVQAKNGEFEGMTALHLAARRGNPHLVRLLLEYKALPDEQDVNGRTALHCLCELPEPEDPEVISAHVQVAKLLLERSPNLWQVLTRSGTLYQKRTALHLAAQNGRHNIVKLLLSKNAVPMWKDENGCTPLHWLCAQTLDANTSRSSKQSLESLQVARLLLERSQHNLISAMDRIRNQTALHYAASNGRLDLVRLLVQFNADITMKDGGEKTAVDWAREAAHDNIIQYLNNTRAAESAMSKVIVPPISQSIQLEESAEFVVYLNKPKVKVQWHKNGEPLKPSENRHIKSSGNVHKVVVERAAIADEGTYECVVPGEKNLAARIHLQGCTEFIHGIDDTKQLWSDTQKQRLVDMCCLRLLLIGDHLAGKTSLARSVMTSKQYVTNRHERTVVMESRSYMTSCNKSFNVVDLGGHPCYQASAHFFYCDAGNNCSLLCHDICSTEYTKTFEWLRGALTRSPNSHIVFVLTKADTVVVPDTLSGKKELFIDSISQMISDEIKLLEETVAVSQAKKSPKAMSFNMLLRKYTKLKEDLRDLTFVTSCVDGGRQSITALEQTIMSIASLKQNHIQLPEQFRKFYTHIGVLGLRQVLEESQVDSLPGERMEPPKSPSVRKVKERMGKIKRKISFQRDPTEIIVAKNIPSNEVRPENNGCAQNSEEKQFVSFEECKKIYRLTVGEKGLQEDRHLERAVKQCLQTLHNHGLVIWFSGTPQLNDCIFNNLSAFIDVLIATFRHDFEELLLFEKLSPKLKILFTNEMEFRRHLEALKKGCMTKPLLQVLMDIGNCLVSAEFVSDLLEKLGIGIPFCPDFFKPQYEGTAVFIPWYLCNQSKPDEFDEIHHSVTSFSESSLSLQCKLVGNIPKTYFYYLCVQLLSHLLVDPGGKQETIWGNGLYIVRGKIAILLHNQPGYIELNVKCSTEGDRFSRLQEAWRYIRYVYDESERLEQQWWPGLVKRNVLICTHCRMNGIEEPHEFDLGHRFYLADIDEHPETQQCRKTGSEIPTSLIQPLPTEKIEGCWNTLLQYMKKLNGENTCKHWLLRKVHDEFEKRLVPAGELLEKLCLSGLLRSEDKTLIRKEANATAINRQILNSIDKAITGAEENSDMKIRNFIHALEESGASENKQLAMLLSGELFPYNSTHL